MKTSASKRPKATREGIVAAARTIARRQGWTAVTIRAIADELGYTSPIVYEHFKNKDDALAAAAQMGFDQLEIVLSGIAAPPGSDARLIALGQAYVDFSLQNPELYRVMHGLDGAVTDPAVIAAGAQGVCELTLNELNAWATVNGVSLADPMATVETMWCLVHGIASLTLVNRLETPEGGRIGFALTILLAGLRADH